MTSAPAAVPMSTAPAQEFMKFFIRSPIVEPQEGFSVESFACGN
jgi:hypothetical protein